MKTIKWFILATSIIALISCNSNIGPIIDDASIDNLIFGNETISDTTKNDNTNQNDTTGGGMGATIIDWGDGGTDDITMTP